MKPRISVIFSQVLYALKMQRILCGVYGKSITNEHLENKFCGEVNHKSKDVIFLSLGETEKQLITQALCRPYNMTVILEIPQATFTVLWITSQSS